MNAQECSVPDLERRIRQRYGTPHQFCKHTGLPRATVYQVLAGCYPGNKQRQASRIQDVLEDKGSPDTVTNVESLSAALSTVACNLCIRKGRCTRRRARRCAEVHAAQARAILALMDGSGRTKP